MTLKEFVRKFTAPILWANFLAMFLLLVALAIGVWKGLEHYTRHGETINVPELKGTRLSAASSQLTRLGLTPVVLDSGYNRALAPGIILEQSPVSGTTVKSGREVYLTVNTGHVPTLPIPDIADNCSVREAEARLKALGFKLAPAETVEGEKDWVYGVKLNGQNILSGERVPIESTLTLQVGAGNADMEMEEELTVDSLWSSDILTPEDIEQAENTL